MKLVPLGTSAASLAHGRHPASLALVREGQILLFDCGDGTLSRLISATLNHGKIAAIFISHLHGDHYLGLFGLLNAMSRRDRSAPLVVVAPKLLSQVMAQLPGVRARDLTFPVELVATEEAIAQPVVYQTRAYKVEARQMDHGTAFAVGYRLEEHVRPGRLDVASAMELGITGFRDFWRLKNGESVHNADGRLVTPDMVLGPPPPVQIFAYTGDTRPCRGAIQLAQDATLFVHDATFADEHRRKAELTGHSTAVQAAKVAQEAGVSRLLLTHFSARYKDLALLVNQARQVFPETEAARELHPVILDARPTPLRVE